MGQKKPNQFALSFNPGFGKNAFDLRPHGVVGHADHFCNLSWRTPITQQQRHTAFGWS